MTEKSTTSGLRVGFVKQEFNPDQAVVSKQIIEGLRAQGAEVRVITGTETTAHGERRPGEPRFRGSTETWNGVQIHRIPFWPSHDASAFRRTATYASFAASSTAVAPWVFRDLDVVLVYGSPVTVASAPLIWSRKLRLPYVLHVQDLWPDSVFATGFLRGGLKERVVRRLLDAFVSSAYRRASAVVAITPGMRRTIIGRGVSAEKVHTIYNWTDEEVFRPMARVTHDGHVLVYAGTLGFAQDLNTVLDALSLARTVDTRLILIGAGPAEKSLRVRVESEGMTNVEFLGRLASTEALERMRSSDLQLVPLADEPLFTITIPSKIQAIMASGFPMIVSAPGEAGQMVVDAEAGFAVPPSNPEALAQAIDSAFALSAVELADMGRKGRSFYEANCSAAEGAARLYQVLVTAASSRTGQRKGDRPGPA